MSLAAYFVKKCADKIEENISLTLAKLSDPSKLVDFEASGALVDAAQGNFGDLRDFAVDYIKDNADGLALMAADALGVKDDALDGINLVYSMMASAMSLYNDLALIYLKKLARNIVKEIDGKIKQEQDLKEKLTTLHNALLSLSAGDPVFEKYLAQLRDALVQLDSGRDDIRFVRNTFDRSDRFLSKRFQQGKDKLDAASKLIKPLEDNPYLQPTAKGIAKNLGIPSEKQQIKNILGIPKMTKNVLVACRSYGTTTLKINSMLVFYFAGLNALKTALPAFAKKFVLGQLDKSLTKLSDLVGGMAVTLNGSEINVFGPEPGFQPVPLKVSVQAFKWAMDLQMLLEVLKTVPSGHVVVERNKAGSIRSAPNGDVLVAGFTGQFSRVTEGSEVEIFAGARTGKYRVRQKLSDLELKLDRKANTSIQLLKNVDFQIISDALGDLPLNQACVKSYLASVAAIKAMGNIGVGGAALLATEGQENSSIFQNQVLGFLVEANLATTSASIRSESLALCRAFIKRCDLAAQRDGDIKAALQAFINTPIPLEEKLEELEAAIAKLLGDFGLDAATDLLESGDFAKFFKLDGKSATYVGAALASIALLKECFDNDTDKAKLSDIQSQLESEQDLLNIKLSFNFDLAIFKNLEDCLNLKGLATMFDAKEIICGLLSQSGAQASIEKAFQKVDDLLSF